LSTREKIHYPHLLLEGGIEKRGPCRGEKKHNGRGLCDVKDMKGSYFFDKEKNA